MAQVVATTFAAVAAGEGALVSELQRLWKFADSDSMSLTKEVFNHLSRRSLMAMLVHWTYLRDLDEFGTFWASLTDYSNPQAMYYRTDYWEQYICQEKASVLKDLGLAFLRRMDSHTNPNAPDLAIVLRGTFPFNLWDLIEDLKISLQKLNESERVLSTVSLILRVVKEFRDKNPGKRICMAGHSLGAAIALIVGGTLYSTHGINIDTHLFNPPLLTVVDVASGGALPSQTATPNPLQVIDRVLKLTVVFSKLKKEYVHALESEEDFTVEWKRFEKLRNWVPHFYLNPGDPICSKYIDFYKNNSKTLETAHDVIISEQGLISRLFCLNANLFINVVPSANLNISNWKRGNVRLAHSLRQWQNKPDDSYVAHLLQQSTP